MACQSEELINFRGWSGPGCRLWITFLLPSPLQNNGFRRFIGVSHAVTSWFSQDSANQIPDCFWL